MGKPETARIRWDLLEENELSKRLYNILLKWAGFANRHYKKWHVKENCGYYFGGAYVYETESVFTAAVMAILAKLGDYDENTVGLSREEIKKRAISTIRYLCFTHTSGPDECVRDKGRYEEFSNRKWGFIYDNFFRDSQTGVGTAAIGLAAWLLWDDLDDETAELAKNLLVSYADRYSEMMPGSGVYNDTQCEENAWTALGISAALYILPEHPHSGKWLDGYIRWSLNTVVTPMDKLEKEWDKVTYESRGGILYDGSLYGISSVTFHPDFTTENHGYVHPDYMAAGIVLRGASAVFPLLKGEEPLESLLYNFKELYDIALKPICSMDGNTIAAQGQDWFYHKHNNKLMIHSSVNILFKDPDAALLERNCLNIIEARQNSIGTGGIMEGNGGDLQITPGKKSAFDMESPSVRTIMLPYLMHLAKGEGAKPTTKDEIVNKLSGNHFYPYGGIYIHRTPDSFTSFTTRCSVMGLSMPLNGLWDITADFMGMTGQIKTKDENDEYFKNKKINWKDLGRETMNFRMNEHKRGFSIYTDVPRASERIKQSVSFTALPDGKAVYMEKIEAEEDVDLAVVETGRVSIGNENFSKLGSIAKGYRDVWFNDQKETFRGYYGDKDEIKEYSNIRYINVDGKMGYLVFGEGNVKYNNMHSFPKWKGLENILVLNKGRTGRIYKGESLPIFAMVSIPGVTHEATVKEHNETHITCRTEDFMVIRGSDYRTACNFSGEGVEITENFATHHGKIPIFPGVTEIWENRYSCMFRMKGMSSEFDYRVLSLIFANSEPKPSLKVLCDDDSNVWIRNTGNSSVKYKINSNGITRHISHKPGVSIDVFEKTR